MLDDGETGITSFYAALEDRPTKRRKIRCGTKLFSAIFFLLALAACSAACLLLLPSYIVERRVKQATVQVLQGTMRISADQHEVLNPAAHIFANKKLLQFLGVRYTAHVRPFKASIHLNLPSGVSMNTLQTEGNGSLNDWQTQGSGLLAYIKRGLLMMSGIDLRSAREKKPLLKLGEIAVAELVMDSTEHFNRTIGGQVELNAPIDHLAFAANEFVSKPLVNATMTATVSVVSMIWGWIPVYLPRVYFEYEYAAKGFDNFESQPLHVSEFASVAGFEGYLRATSMAQVYNPTPFSLQLDTPLSMRIDHALHGKDHTVGFASLSHLRVNPGWNNITGNLTVVQTDSNIDAIEDLATLYCAERDDTIDQHIYVTIRDAGEDTASSKFLQKVCSRISTRVGFLPPLEDYIEGVSADALFAGSLISFHPEFYHITMNMRISSPLSQDVSVSYLEVKAYRNDINGSILYNAQRHLNPGLYNVPANAKDHFVPLVLRRNEVNMGTSFQDYLYMCQSGATAHAPLGFDSRMVVNIGPGGFKQAVRYKRHKIVGVMCYHMAKPPWRCGEHMQIWSEMPGNASSIDNSTEPQPLTVSPIRYV